MTQEGKPISHSRMEMRHKPQPAESNTNGVMHGGYILYHLDTAGGMSAARHAGSRVVTVSVDRMDFKSPVRMGEDMLYRTSVNMVHRSSIEVGARIEAENPYTGETRHVGTAYLTFVALNEEGRPTAVRPLIPETPEDRRRMADAARRRNLRRMERAQANGKAFSFRIALLPERYALCRLEPGEAVPAVAAGAFFAMAQGGNELSLVLPEESAPASGAGLKLDKGWRAFMLRAELDVSLSGVVANLSAIIAAERISIYYVTTFSTGYFLVREDNTRAAADALRLAGHTVD